MATGLIRSARLQRQGAGPMFAPVVLAFVLVLQTLVGHIVPIQSSGMSWSHYVGALYHQIDGSKYQHYNCVESFGTLAMDCTSMGYWRVSASTLHAKWGMGYAGMAYDTLVSLVAKVTNGEVKLTRLYWMPVEKLDTLLETPRVVGISILTSITAGTPFATGTFRGRHCVSVVDKRTYHWVDDNDIAHSQLQYLVGDPGRSSVEFKWWPATLLRRAAAASTGQVGQVHVMYTPDLEGVTLKARTASPVFSKPDSTSPVVGTISTGSTEDVIRTVKGTNWAVITGGATHRGNGWAQIKNAVGKTGWVPGGRIRRAA
jgi:hypothetical protein